jgi:CMP-N-acetylneuraminic acid synthetase
MNIVAFIFARGGSKGLSNKNIKIFNGKPLIAWSIEHAKSINRIGRVIVSTDSEEIAKTARAFGAEVPFIRPKELATDESPEWLSWQHALEFIYQTDGRLPDLMLSIPTTSPLRRVEDINKIIDEYLENDTDVVITVTEPYRSPYFNIVKDSSDGYVELFIKSDKSINRRQDCPKTFDMTTVAYAAKPSFVISNTNIFDGKVRKIIVSKETSVDIDTLFDFEYAEFLVKKGV